MRRSRTSVCSFQLYQAAIAFVDLYSGRRAARDVASDADSKIKQYQDSFNNLKLELQQHAVIHTEIIVLRVLDVVDKIGEFYDLKPFPKLIRLATSRRS
jgi:hypothetical protein